VTLPTKQVHLFVEQSLFDLISEDPNDKNLLQFISTLNSARDCISHRQLGDIRLVEEPTIDIIRSCLRLTQKYIDQAYELLSQTTVVERDGDVAKLAYFIAHGQSFASLQFSADFQLLLIDSTSVRLHD